MLRFHTLVRTAYDKNEKLSATSAKSNLFLPNKKRNDKAKSNNNFTSSRLTFFFSFLNRYYTINASQIKIKTKKKKITLLTLHHVYNQIYTMHINEIKKSKSKSKNPTIFFVVVIKKKKKIATNNIGIIFFQHTHLALFFI